MLGKKLLAAFLCVWLCVAGVSVPACALGEDLYPDCLGVYSTTSTNTKNGTYNMQLALSKINYTRLEPEEIFSFNEKIGRANRANGYKQADAILEGRLTPVYGGGICQASTTVYGAVLRSGLKIIERKNHSIPSNYCPIGQDAMVNQPGQDFRFQNDTGHPVYIEAGVENNVLTVKIYGHRSEEYDSIEITSKQTASIKAPKTARYVRDNTLQPGQTRWVAKARAGIRASAQRVFYKDGEVVRAEELPASYYPPSGAICLVGPEPPKAESVVSQ